MDFLDLRRSRSNGYADDPMCDAQTFFNGGIAVEAAVTFSDATGDILKVQSIEELEKILQGVREKIAEKVKGCGSHDSQRAYGLVNDFEHDAHDWFNQKE